MFVYKQIDLPYTLLTRSVIPLVYIKHSPVSIFILICIVVSLSNQYFVLFHFHLINIKRQVMCVGFMNYYKLFKKRKGYRDYKISIKRQKVCRRYGFCTIRLHVTSFFLLCYLICLSIFRD